MKKIFLSLMLTIFLVIATMCGGCTSSTFESNLENGGQEVETIKTLEGTWMSEYGKTEEHCKAVIAGTSIKLYSHGGLYCDYVLEWVGIYVPFTEPISEGTWTFENDVACKEERSDNYSKEFTYSDKTLSCKMVNNGEYTTVYFTKVSD